MRWLFILPLLALCAASLWFTAASSFRLLTSELSAVADTLIWWTESFRLACHSPSGWWMFSQISGMLPSMLVFVSSESRRFNVSGPIAALVVIALSLTSSASVAWPIFLIAWQAARARHQAQDATTPAASPPPHHTSPLLWPALLLALVSHVFIPRHSGGKPSSEFRYIFGLSRIVLLLPLLWPGAPVQWTRPAAAAATEAAAAPSESAAAKSGQQPLLAKRSRLVRSPPFAASVMHLTVVYGMLALVMWLFHIHTIIGVLGEIQHKSPLSFTTGQFASMAGIADFINTYVTTIADRAWDADTASQPIVAWDLVLLYAEMLVFFIAQARDVCSGLVFCLCALAWLPVHVVFPLFLLNRLWDEQAQYAPAEASSKTREIRRKSYDSESEEEDDKSK